MKPSSHPELPRRTEGPTGDSPPDASGAPRRARPAAFRGSRRTKRFLIGTAAVLGVLVGFLVEERVRGHLALKAWERGTRARGERLTIAELAPPITNLAVRVLTPGQWQSILVPSSAQEPSVDGEDIPAGQAVVLWRLREWHTRNGATNNWARFATEFVRDQERLAGFRAYLTNGPIVVRLPYEQGFGNLMPHLGPLRGTVQSLRCDTLLALHEQRLDDVVENLRVAAVLVELLSHETVLINQLVRVAVAEQALGGMLWQALQADGWTDAQLAAIQSAWEPPRFLPGLARAFQMERAMVAPYFQGRKGDLREILDGGGWSYVFGDDSGPGAEDGTLREWFGPILDQGQRLRRLAFIELWKFAWAEQDQLFHCQAVQRVVEAVRTATNARNVAGLGRAGEAMVSGSSGLLEALPKHHSTYVRARHWFSFTALQASGLSLGKAAQTECRREMSVAALGLKRYRLRHGQWPESLDALVPQFLSELPRDWMNGEPLRYRRNPDDTFTLYSVGLDGKDEGGDPAPRAGTKVSFFHGRDMVWERPATEAPAEADGRRADSAGGDASP